ncbi:MAG: diguanylate cyclase [Candidatus Accumulibacter sp.]|jgi:diguanylate cyclase (GGDEF)-like protein|nr:diguanylate cyclase [Accumulibacter sp.]
MSAPEPLPRILVADESRMVRAMLIRHIREFYDFREEANGESAWQVLVLDHSIKLAICSLSLPVLDGDGLLTRVRSSRLSRLAQMPMLMITGDDEKAVERAKSHGASDFIDRGTGEAELLARVDTLLKLARAREQLKENLEQQVQNPETGIFTRKYIELQALQAMSHTMRHNGEASVMVMGFDNAGALRDEHGMDALKQLQQRFIAVLSGKIRKEDSLGHHLGSQLAVISPGTSRAACETFGNRLREAVSVANITVHGRRLALSVSIGISSSPADEVASASALIELADARLKAAQQAGGNRVVSGEGAAALTPPAPSLERALTLLREGHESAVEPHLAELGGRLLPLLGLMDRKLALHLPLAEIARKVKREK